MQNIIEGNKLIAKLMGFVDDAEQGTMNLSPGSNIPYEQLKYHESWDWLMQAVEKVERLHDGIFSFFIVQTECDIAMSSKYKENGEDWYAPNFAKKAGDKLTSTWQAVVGFLEWYNKEIKHS